MLTPDQRRDEASQICLNLRDYTTYIPTQMSVLASIHMIGHDCEVKHKLSVGVKIPTTNNTIIMQLSTPSFAALMLLELTWVKCAY